MYRVVLTLAWFVGPIYAMIPLLALIIRPFKKFLRARRSPLYVIIPSWFVMMAVVYFMTWPWREAVLYHALAAWLAGFPIRYRHSDLLSLAPALLSDSHRGPPRPKPGRKRRLELRASVNRSDIPSTLPTCACCWVGAGEIVLYGLTILALLTGWPMIRHEQAELEHRLSEEYRALSVLFRLPSCLASFLSPTGGNGESR